MASDKALERETGKGEWETRKRLSQVLYLLAIRQVLFSVPF